MLVLKRDRGESVTIAALDLNGKPLCWMEITIERGGPVRLGFTSNPGDFKILRTELMTDEQKGGEPQS
jgi:sRNA-binding carbon storage regulator CsrA